MFVFVLPPKVDRRQRLILQAEEESNQDTSQSPKTNPDTPGKSGLQRNFSKSQRRYRSSILDTREYRGWSRGSRLERDCLVLYYPHTQNLQSPRTA